MRHSHLRSRGWVAGLFGAALPLLGGCLVVTYPVPGGLEATSDSPIAGAVGESAGSDKPIRPGAGRDFVHRRAGGDPQDADPAGAWEHYAYQETWGTFVEVVVIGACHAGRVRETPIVEHARHLLLSYDAGGVVRTARVLDTERYLAEERRLRKAGVDLRPVLKPSDPHPSAAPPPTTQPDL